MASTPALDKLFQFLQLKRPAKGPLSITPTFKPAAPLAILPTLPYRDHLTALSDNRATMDARDLMQFMFHHDPDVSATVGAYLTLADTRLTVFAKNYQGQIDPAMSLQLQQLVTALFRVINLQQGFTLKTNVDTFCQQLRYMLMLRGAVGCELVFDKNLIPQRIQQVDMKTVWWYETEDGMNKPEQRVPGAPAFIPLDIPSFFISYHRRDPTTIYPQSDFVSVINTAAARQQVINELYRIMQVTGFPRISLKVMEDVLLKNAPVNIRDDPNTQNKWMSDRLGEIANTFSGLRSDQAFAHFDSIEPSVINDKNPGMAVDISKVIDVLNAQNQAALKTMATVIGRGSGGVNTASVEARIFAMSADQLNVPVKDILDQVFTFLMSSYGMQGYAECTFDPAELRPRLELEPQLMLKASRLRQDLSDGILSDEEYSMEMYGRLPTPGAPPLSGTKFQQSNSSVTDATAVSPNGDPLGRSLSGEGGNKMPASNGVK